MNIMNTGKVSKKDDGLMIEFERILNHPIEKVWDALTNPAVLRIWMTEVEMDFRPGGQMKLYFQDANKTVTHGKVVTINKPTLFEYFWEDEFASWKLEAMDDKTTKLHFTYSKLDEKYAFQAPAGWHSVLDQLQTVLDGRTEPYPFGVEGGPTPEALALQEIYKKQVVHLFPAAQQW
jgi:uncharacterized protein YndB with AHSA1/START domain